MKSIKLDEIQRADNFDVHHIDDKKLCSKQKQFLLLLGNEDDLNRSICQTLMQEIDLVYLIGMEYVVFKDE